ncbi:hypothetical protein PIROE2DRAFT_13104, partial [Piromyces sp. E2]
IGSKPTTTNISTSTVMETSTATVNANPTENSSIAVKQVNPSATTTQSNRNVGNSTRKGITNHEVNEVNGEKNSNGVGIAVGVVVAGVAATAAIAGFVFLKKHKKITSSDEEFNLATI